MIRSSFFIKNKALFGSYPTQDSVTELEEHGIKHFIDLTCQGEKKIVKYDTKYNYINYPIYDHNIPNNIKTFTKVIIKICNIISKLKNNEKIYIHCKGGHGRSGIVVACVLVHYFKISVKKALVLTNKYHSRRKEMREKWRKIGSPQTYLQKRFVYNFYKPIMFKSHHKLGMDFKHEIKVPNMGEYNNVKEAYNESKKLFMDDSNWEYIKYRVMYTILYNAYKESDVLREFLLNTGIRKIIYMNSHEYWGKKNMYGKILVKVRNKLIMEYD